MIKFNFFILAICIVLVIYGTISGLKTENTVGDILAYLIGAFIQLYVFYLAYQGVIACQH